MRQKLSIKELFNLKPGEKFIVYWAKDDDPRDVRLNYKTQIITSNDKETITVDDLGYEWYKTECPDEEDNLLDTSRGYAYFYLC